MGTSNKGGVEESIFFFSFMHQYVFEIRPKFVTKVVDLG